jgi:2',3'-cyclic-nucleotide 2'-phosphodiesterase (5'-nucleotidase family)
MARWASLIQQRRTEKPVLLVDAGDFCSNLRTRHQDIKDRYFFKGMQRLGYDAIGVGETDIRYGRKRLLETMKRADLPLVSSNLIDKRANGHLVSPYIITTVGGRRVLFWRKGGIKVGILSIILPVYIHSIDEEINKYFDVQNTKITAFETASTLRSAGCDLIIALSHLGWKNSLTLAQEVPGLDIVVNGHRSHNGMHHEFAGETLVIDTGINRSSFTEIVVTITDGKPRFSPKDMGQVLLSFDGDPAFLALEKSYERELEALKTGGSKGDR